MLRSIHGRMLLRAPNLATVAGGDAAAAQYSDPRSGSAEGDCRVRAAEPATPRTAPAGAFVVDQAQDEVVDSRGCADLTDSAWSPRIARHTGTRGAATLGIAPARQPGPVQPGRQAI